MSTSKYDDIIGLPHHRSMTRTPMPMRDRAAQFAPFAALTGYDRTIAETGRRTDSRIELGEDERQLLDRKLLLLQAMEQPEIRLLYFVPDERKEGGAYRERRGRLKKLDEYERCIVLLSGERIAIDDILSLDSEELEHL